MTPVGQELQEGISIKAQRLSEMHSRCSQQSKKVIHLKLVAEEAFVLDELYPTKLIQSSERGQQHQKRQII